MLVSREKLIAYRSERLSKQLVKAQSNHFLIKSGEIGTRHEARLHKNVMKEASGHASERTRAQSGAHGEMTAGGEGSKAGSENARKAKEYLCQMERGGGRESRDGVCGLR